LSLTPLPLAEAAERLRGKPGRPRLSDEEKARRAAKGAETRRERLSAQLATITPRLLDFEGASRYSSLSVWTLRDLVASGKLPRVVIPSAAGDKDLRVVRVDKADLDRLIDSWKEGA
jgi:hypothetical protein